MTISNILRFTCVALLASLSLPLLAQRPAATDTLSAQQDNRVRGIQYQSREAAATAMQQAQVRTFAGVAISVDVVGPVMAVACPFGSYEAAARFNFKERYFPIAEVGWGSSNHTDETTDLHYKTNAPYFRIGLDYNFNKNRLSGNRIFGGLRYGFSSYKYDLDGPDIIDPIWGTATPYHFRNLKANAHWAEAVFGLEARIVRFFHLGWSIRYRFLLSQKSDAVGKAWYIPGYGRNNGPCLSGTFNLIFDISGKPSAH